MTEILIIIAVTAGAFIATNLDNLVLLVALYSRYKQHSGLVAFGYITGMIIIGAISVAVGEVGDFIPVTYLGYLGVVPIMLGITALIRLARGTQSGEASSFATSTSSRAIFVTVVLTQLSNSADSIITFSALFADSLDATDYLIAPTFLAMSVIFAWLAYYLQNHRSLSQVLDRYGHYLTPFILILVGFYILANTASDLAPG